MIYLSRRITFSAAHRYYQKAFSEEKNKAIFGSCYSAFGHGHNYVLDLTVGGEIDGETGMVINLVDVDQILKTVTEPLDHHHLNFDVPAFKDTVPTTENLAKYCFEEIEKLMPPELKAKPIRVRIYEADNLWADYYG